MKIFRVLAPVLFAGGYAAHIQAQDVKQVVQQAVDTEVAADQNDRSLEEQVELLSLIGDIALKDNEPQVHAHLVIGRRTEPLTAATR